MRFAAEGHLLMLGSVGVSALVFALALHLRSWPVWLAGLACTVGAVLIAWQYRLPLPSA
jgi:membrane protein implicated in regulation of membrane protease activity